MDYGDFEFWAGYQPGFDYEGYCREVWGDDPTHWPSYRGARNIEESYGGYDPRSNMGRPSLGMRSGRGRSGGHRQPHRGSRNRHGGSHDGSDLDLPEEHVGGMRDPMDEAIRQEIARRERMGEPMYGLTRGHRSREYSPPRPDGLPAGRDSWRGQDIFNDFDPFEDPMRQGAEYGGRRRGGRGVGGGRGGGRRQGMGRGYGQMMGPGMGYPPMQPGMARMGDGSLRPRIPSDDAHDEEVRMREFMLCSGYE